MLLVPLVAVSCGGDDDGSRQPPAREASGPTGAVRPAKEAPKSNRVDRYVRERFGGADGPKASWYEHVEAVEVSGRTTTVRTDIRKGADVDRVAHEICSALIGSVPGSTDVVRVTGAPADAPLAECVP